MSNRHRRDVIADETGITVHPEATDRTVVAFHHAGGSTLSLLPFASSFPADVRIRLAELPGRGFRSAEDPAPDFESAVSDALRNTAAFITGTCIVFGHSLGAWMAYELFRRLAPAQQASVRAVVLSACPLPRRQRINSAQTPIRRADAELIELMRRCDGTPQEVFVCPAMLRSALNLLGEDMCLLDGHRFTDSHAHAPVPYEIWYGADDPVAGQQDPSAWADFVGAPVRLRQFSGGHFYLFNDHAVADRLTDLVSGAPGHGERSD